MDSKYKNQESFNPLDVAPLPSAPPPSYDDAMGTSSAHNFQNDVALLTGNASMSAPGNQVPAIILPQAHSFPAPPYPIQSQPFPTQQVQVTPAQPVLGNMYLPVGRRSLKATCPGCNTYINSKIETSNNCHPTFWCVVLFLTGFWCCCCLPYCICNKPYRVDHFCPSCNAFLGTYYES